MAVPPRPTPLHPFPSVSGTPRQQILDQKRVVSREEVNIMKIRTSVKAGAIMWGT